MEDKTKNAVFRCKCSKYIGAKYRGVICDVCGSHIIKRRGIDDVEWILLRICDQLIELRVGLGELRNSK